MTQHYSNPKRANDPHALPDLETFEITKRDWSKGMCPMCADDCNGTPANDQDTHNSEHLGWYWQSCRTVSLNGPFDTEELALADARDGMDGGADDGDCVDCDGPCQGHDVDDDGEGSIEATENDGADDDMRGKS